MKRNYWLDLKNEIESLGDRICYLKHKFIKKIAQSCEIEDV